MTFLSFADSSPISIKQLIFIGAVSFVVVVALAILLFFPIRRWVHKTRFLYLFYKKVRSVAIDRDFYLIISQYYNGDLVGKQTDHSLILVNKKGEKKYCDNPVERSKFLMSRLSMSTGIDTVMMIGIVMVNDNCKLQIETNSKQFYIIQRSKFPALIKAIEQRKIGNINAAQLDNLVKAIDKLNKKKK